MADLGGTPLARQGRILVGHLEDGRLVADRDLTAGDPELHPWYKLGVGPCG